MKQALESRVQALQELAAESPAGSSVSPWELLLLATVCHLQGAQPAKRVSLVVHLPDVVTWRPNLDVDPTRRALTALYTAAVLLEPDCELSAFGLLTELARQLRCAL